MPAAMAPWLALPQDFSDSSEDIGPLWRAPARSLPAAGAGGPGRPALLRLWPSRKAGAALLLSAGFAALLWSCSRRGGAERAPSSRGQFEVLEERDDGWTAPQRTLVIAQGLRAAIQKLPQNIRTGALVRADELPEGAGLPEGLPEGGEVPEGQIEGATTPLPDEQPLPVAANDSAASPCPRSSEAYGSSCYRTCSNLTNGKYPYRFNSFMCCTADGYSACSMGSYGELVEPREESGCAPNEELLGGLCYKACELLTQGQYRFRLDAQSCCKKSGYWSCRHPGNVLRSEHFNVGGGGGCPEETELVGHFCYQKCSLLTSGLYPRRHGGRTCCKTEHCLWPGNFWVSERFNVGGDMGCADGAELHAGQCYERCTLLTNGSYPTRTAVATCCKEEDVRRCGQHGTLWTDLGFAKRSQSGRPVHVPARAPA